jgi:hypothetical protein
MISILDRSSIQDEFSKEHLHLNSYYQKVIQEMKEYQESSIYQLRAQVNGLQSQLQEKQKQLTSTNQKLNMTTQVFENYIKQEKEENEEDEEKEVSIDEVQNLSFSQIAINVKPLLDKAKINRDFGDIDDYLLVLKEKHQKIHSIELDMIKGIELIEKCIKNFHSKHLSEDKSKEDEKKKKETEAINYLESGGIDVENSDKILNKI